MGSKSGRDDARSWHGQHIVGERDLDFHSDQQALQQRRRRQNTVFTVLALVVALVLVLALLVFTGRLQFPGQQPRATADEPAPIANAHCPQRDFDYLEPESVQVRVLNATGQAGLAGRTAQLLEERGFTISSTTSGASDYSEQAGAVVSGPEGYAQAMSLQRHLPGTVYVLDEDKRGQLVDFEVGAEFSELTKTRRLDTTSGPLTCADRPEEQAEEQ